MKILKREFKYMTEPELGETMTAFAKAIVDTAEKMGVEKPHFTLVVFNDPEIAQYASNCRREDIIKAMRETADRLEKNQDLVRTQNKS